MVGFRPVDEGQECQRVTLIVKAIGTLCNLRCSYCFFHETDQAKPRIMQDEVLTKVIREYLEFSSINVFVWHGGEPLLAGIPFYQKAVELQRQFASSGNKMVNYLQTNLTLVNRQWARFFKEFRFKIGVSIDGPKHVHNMHRLNSGGDGSFGAAIRGFEILREEGINPGCISVITRKTLPFLTDILNFSYHDLSIKRIAFNTFDSNGRSEPDGLALSKEEHLQLLVTCFNYWLEKDDSEFSIREVDELIAGAAGLPPNSCGFSGTCHEFVTVDERGSFYTCERMSSEWLFGNIMSETLDQVLAAERRQRFVRQQMQDSPAECRSCEFFPYCHNGCTSFRENLSAAQVQGRYIYCFNRRYMFRHIREVFGGALPQMAQNFAAAMTGS